MNLKQFYSRALCKLSICIPIILAFTLYYDSKILYIKELHYMRNPHWAYIMFIAFNLIWQASGARKYFGGYYEILFNLFPTEVFLMLYFAQRHFKITLLFFVISVLLLLMAVKDNFKGKGKCRTKREYRLIKRENYRWLLIAVCLLYCIPSFFSYFVYDMEGTTYTPSSDNLTAASIKDDDLFENPDDPFENNRTLLLEFREDTWKQKDTQEKLDLSQQFVNFEAKRLGIESVPVSSQKLNNIITIAYYTGETNEIMVDEQSLNEQTGEETMNTLCEETYHAMEHYIVDNMNWDISVINTEYFQELRDWKDNMENYTYGGWSNFDEYESQPIEASAKKYASEEVQQILEYLDSISAD